MGNYIYYLLFLLSLLARTFAMNPYKAWTSPEKVDRVRDLPLCVC